MTANRIGWVGRVCGAVGMAVVVALSLVAGLVTPVAAHHSYPRVEIMGGGWGHGRGMGQYGALGYARDHGWSSRQILDHFYGGTTQGPAQAIDNLNPNRLRVQLATMNDRYTTVTLSAGRMVLVDGAGKRRATVSQDALRLVPRGDGFEVQTAQACHGPWTRHSQIEGRAIGIRVELDPNDPSDDGEVIGADSHTLLGVCGPTNRTWYDGEIWAHRTPYGRRTVNTVTVEQYLRGVVPNEVPASWPEAVLQAQAVAARSYVLAGDRRWGSHADTCDNTYCQVYDGRVTTRGGTRSATHQRTDAAITATAGQVRLTSAGRVARTEFSSSTGGHTAGGDFTAVEDKGDATSANPNSSWSVTKSLSGLASRYGLGPVRSIEVTERDGHGRFGGRAKVVTVTFRDGTRTMSGSAIRIHFGLKSELFDFGPIQFEPPADDGSDQPVTAVDYKPLVETMYRRLAGRAPDEAELARAVARLEDDEAAGRRELAAKLVRSDYFSGALVDDLYRVTLGRKADDAGRAHWVDRLTASGPDRLSYQEIGAYFFGSAEYYRRAGNTDRDFVDRLYRDLLNRQADRAGRHYWLSVLHDGSGTNVVTWFYRSEESRRNRAATIGRLVTGTDLTEAQIGAAADTLLTVDDLELAASLASAINP